MTLFSVAAHMGDLTQTESLRLPVLSINLTLFHADRDTVRQAHRSEENRRTNPCPNENQSVGTARMAARSIKLPPKITFS
jgi:hypothetical protein